MTNLVASRPTAGDAAPERPPSRRLLIGIPTTLAAVLVWAVATGNGIYALGFVGFVLALLISVSLHEGGHFWTARRYGMKVLLGIWLGHDPEANAEQIRLGIARVQATIERFGGLDVLVNNVGTNPHFGATLDVDPARYDKTFEVNLRGPLFWTKHAWELAFVDTPGVVVNIASVAGKEGNPRASHYSASKAGLIGLTKSLGKELAGTGVLANCITPAAARTDLFAQMTEEQIDYMLSRIPMGRFVEVAEIAALACWLASEDCSFSTGAVFDISGGRATY